MKDYIFEFKSTMMIGLHATTSTFSKGFCAENVEEAQKLAEAFIVERDSHEAGRAFSRYTTIKDIRFA